MRELFKILSYIINHPISGKSKVRSFFRFFWWQFRNRLTTKEYVHSFTENSKLIIRKGMTGATGNLYCGLHEYQEMLFLLHFLRKEDVFIDVGANIGSYTILASAEIGAFSYSFEPVPNTFYDFNRNIIVNSIGEKVKAYNYGVGSSESKLTFSNNPDSSMNSVVYDETGNENNFIVDVVTLNKALYNVSPSMMKIDVEGFEMEVLKGASDILNNKKLNAIIIELNGSGEKYGFSDLEIHHLLVSYGFEAFRYDPFVRELNATILGSTDNYIYIRDIDFVKERLTSAKKIKVLNSNI